MSKRITQETFDDAVKENMEEFGMERDEAVIDAAQQFEAQGPSLPLPARLWLLCPSLSPYRTATGISSLWRRLQKKRARERAKGRPTKGCEARKATTGRGWNRVSRLLAACPLRGATLPAAEPCASRAEKRKREREREKRERGKRIPNHRGRRMAAGRLSLLVL